MESILEQPYDMGKYLLRELEFQDLQEISNWPKYDTPFLWANFNHFSSKMQRAWMQRNRHSNVTWFVVESLVMIIGRGSFIQPTSGDDLILGIVLRPDLINQGIGTKVMEMICKYIFSLGYPSIWLETKMNNHIAMRVWEKLGFQSLGEHYRKEVFGVYSQYQGFRLHSPGQLGS